MSANELEMDESFSRRVLDAHGPEHEEQARVHAAELDLLISRDAALPRIVAPIVAELAAPIVAPRGKQIELTLRTPEQLVSLAKALANQTTQQRFGLLIKGQNWGYIAGVVSPRLFRPQKKPPTMKEILAQWRFSGRVDKNLKLTLLLIDTFRLDSPLREEVVERAIGMIVNSPEVKPIKMGTLRMASPAPLHFSSVQFSSPPQPAASPPPRSPVSLLDAHEPEHEEQAAAELDLLRSRDAALPIVVPIVADLAAPIVAPRGKQIMLALTTPEQVVSLAAALANPTAQQRFGLLIEGQNWGYLAGVVSPRLPPQKKPPTIKEILVQWRFSGRVDKPLKLTLLLVDTFHLDAEPREEAVEVAVGKIVNSPEVKPIRIGTLRMASPSPSPTTSPSP